MSQSALGARVGIQSTSISKLERGLFMPAADTLIAIADACGVDPRWIMTGQALRASNQEAGSGRSSS